MQIEERGERREEQAALAGTGAMRTLVSGQHFRFYLPTLD